MASNEQAEDSVETSTSVKEVDVDVSTFKPKTEKKASLNAAATDKDNILNNIVEAETKENTSDVIEEKNNVKEKNENEQNSKSQIIDKNEPDDNKVDEKEDTKGEPGKQKTEVITQSLQSQKVKEENEEMGEVKTEIKDEEKDLNKEDNKDSLKGGSSLKRKRKTLNSSDPLENSSIEADTRSKRKKLKNSSDKFCWRCHKESVEVFCSACPRSWHRKCIGANLPAIQKWICGECATILKAENAETRSAAMSQLSMDQLCMLLKYVVERMHDYPGSEPFSKPVDLNEVPNYLDYVIKPMDLNLLEFNVLTKLYGSTDAFMADAKWIQHNCIVFNTCGGVYADTSKLTNASKQIIKVARSEISEIEACPDCYAHSRNLPRPQPSWFIEPCRRPHTLVWAKLKGFPFWPAKAMPRVNSQGFVDVRFFGEHDRAWVSPKDLYLYSEEPPAPSSRKRKSDMDECVREITRHCRKLELMFGQFKFAPPKVQYNPNDLMQITLMLPNYNPLLPNNHLTNCGSSTTKKKSPLRKRNLLKDCKSQNDESETMDDKEVNSSKGIEDSDKEIEVTAARVQKLSSDSFKNTLNSQNNLNNSSKLTKMEDQGVATVVQNKSIKDSSKTGKTPLVSLKDKGNSCTPSASVNTVENNSQKTKAEVKTNNLSKNATSAISESSDTTRTQKKSLLKNATGSKQEIAANAENASKPVPKNAKGSLIKVYKPKAQMVDKLNAEKALKSIAASKENNNKLTSNASGLLAKKGVSLLSNNTKDLIAVTKKMPEKKSPAIASNTKILSKIESRSIGSTNIHTPARHPTDPKSVLLFVVNNGMTAESAKQQQSTIADCQENKDVLAMTNNAKDSSLPKKENKAKKRFPSSKSRDIQSPSLSAVNATESTGQANSKSETSYQMIPPEAGPISARLHHNAQELVRRISQMMEEAYKEAAQIDVNGEKSTADNYQATIFFLRMQIEHMKWQHQQQIAELKHNADRTMREMRASLEAEKLRFVEETRRELEEDKALCIEETKRKQWCAKCGEEALFYCCWNTAYCNYPCQQSHWPSHMRTCSQQPTFSTIVATANSAANANSQSQNDNDLAQDTPGRVYVLPRSKLSGTSSSQPTTTLKDSKSNEESL